MRYYKADIQEHEAVSIANCSWAAVGGSRFPVPDKDEETVCQQGRLHAPTSLGDS